MARRSLLGTLRDAGDILKHTRPRELLRAVLPGSQRLILNDGGSGGAAGVAPLQQLTALRRRLQGEVFDDAGGCDYRRLAGSPTYAELEATSRALATAALDFADDAERVAFWLNVYNVLTIHGVIALGVERSVMEFPTFFGRVAYRVGGHVLVLDEIENGVLRRNSPHPVSGKPMFKAGDPRLALMAATVDPRIHAALVCGAKSCPPIAMYDPGRLDAQLDDASAALLTSVAVDDAAQTVEIPLVLAWYERDFGGPDGVREFVIHHAGVQRDAVSRALAVGYRLVHARYDWSLNGA